MRTLANSLLTCMHSTYNLPDRVMVVGVVFCLFTWPLFKSRAGDGGVDWMVEDERRGLAHCRRRCLVRGRGDLAQAIGEFSIVWDYVSWHPLIHNVFLFFFFFPSFVSFSPSLSLSISTHPLFAPFPVLFAALQG